MSSAAKKKRPTATTDPSPESNTPAFGSAAMDAMSSIFANPSAPPQKRMRASGGGGGDTGSSCTVRGVVLAVQKESFKNREGIEVPKIRLHVAVDTIVPNNDMALVNSSVDGINYLLPTRQVDTPDLAESTDKFAAKPRELVVDDYTRARWCGMVSPSFYLKSQKGEDLGVQKCTVGMPVEVRGIKCAFGTGMNSHKVYVNASKVVPLKDEPIPKAEVAKALMEAAQTANMLKWTALGTSMCMHGFFGLKYDDEALTEQANACEDLWTLAVQSSASRLDAIAAIKPGESSDSLKNHAARVRSMPGGVLAQSARFFNEEDHDFLYAPIVQTGLRPDSRFPAAIKTLQSADSTMRETLPNYFSTALISNVGFTGGRVDLEAKLQWVFDKTKAIAAIGEGKSPILHTGAAAGMATQMSLRDLAHTLGSMHREKAMFAGKELLPIAEMVIWARLFAKSPAESGLTSEFPQTWAIDVPKTLGYSSFLVSEAWVKEHLCGGASQYVPDAIKADDKLELPKNVSEMPSFLEMGYQELTYSGWKLSNLAVVKGYAREFRVVFEGCVDALRQEPTLATDSAKAIERISTLAAASETEIGTFLSQSCLVYAVKVQSLD